MMRVPEWIAASLTANTPVTNQYQPQGLELVCCN